MGTAIVVGVFTLAAGLAGNWLGRKMERETLREEREHARALAQQQRRHERLLARDSDRREQFVRFATAIGRATVAAQNLLYDRCEAEVYFSRTRDLDHAFESLRLSASSAALVDSARECAQLFPRLVSGNDVENSLTALKYDYHPEADAIIADTFWEFYQNVDKATAEFLAAARKELGLESAPEKVLRNLRNPVLPY